MLDRIVGFERLTAWAGAGQALALAELTTRRTADDPNELPYARDKHRPDDRTGRQPIPASMALRLAAWSELDQPDTARQLYERALPIWERAYGTDHRGRRHLGQPGHRMGELGERTSPRSYS